MSSPNFLIYDASAGSGKTFTLTKEYLKILLAAPTVDAYKKILAITFTNKAVNEMKSRIVSNLIAFGEEEISPDSADMLKAIGSELGLDNDTIKQKSRAIIKNIIHNYASFDISTIDKFTHRLIRTFAIDLELPATFEVSLDKSSLIKEAVDRIIAKAGSTNEKQLTHLLLDFALTKVNESGSWDFTRELVSIGNLIGDENHDKELEAIQNISLDNFIEIRKEVIENRNVIHESVCNLAQQLLSFISNQPYGVEAFSRKTIPNHLNKIIEGDFTKALEYDNIAVLEKRINKKYIDAVNPDLQTIWQQLETIKNWTGRYLLFDNVVKNITPLSLINTISNEVKQIQKEQNMLLISEFNKLIYNEVQQQPAPFIYERLGDKYNHFFIDEFQDTSEMQWKNLVPLLTNALAGNEVETDLGSVMLVGDAKQSIYRWRGGNPEQFIELSKPDAKDEGFESAKKQVTILETNYRSYDAVVTFNNDFFKFLGSKLNNPDYNKMYEVNSFQKTNNKPGGYVSLQFIPDVKDVDDEVTSDDLYLQKTEVIIRNCLVQGFNYKDIALLTRRRDKGVLLANYLTKNGIPIISSETLLLANADDVNFIISLLHLLRNFNDTEAKFDALFYLKNNYLPENPTHDFIVKGLKTETETEFENFLTTTINRSFNFANHKKQDLYQVCENIIALFLPAKSATAYVQYFLDVVLEQETKQLGLDEFLTFWHNKKEVLSIPSPENMNAVTIMTVHKSKGLEFPVVIFPFVNDRIIRTSGDTLWVDLPSTENIPLNKALISKKGEVVHYSDAIANLFEITNEKITLDTINVLYVALTRAREQLYVISEKKNVKLDAKIIESNSVAAYFLEYLRDIARDVVNDEVFDFGTKQKVSKTEVVQNTNQVIEAVTPGNKPSDAIKLANKEALLWHSGKDEAIDYGNLVHELMASVLHPDQVDFVAEQALRQGKLDYKDFDKIKYLLKNIVNDSKIAAHFNPEALVLNERSIVNANFKTIKPDRVTLVDNKATLLDYKTGAKEESHINQVLEYEKALLNMGYEVVKKTLCYIRIDEVEVVDL
ncbi:UvrD-helicase domain-containing protein [Flavobacterium agricola]|uniref:DNA 3'-5' helicase n=1 Tax=Flavobacterium agricola TaxID=2870839 RepID=A0ABY6LWZ9_9FLAO|nr:UvrD-helicase domain-containing protein [Flavobacterium agricola]UYW00860.1 UvrD-helicase domain-containing protein [Flavobacterium agricola]